MHRVRLDWRLGAVDHRSYLRTAAVFVDAFERLGLCSRVANDGEPDAVLPSDHQLGTTRMSCRQEDGVVDADCRIHTLENAYIMGGSVLPTVSWANPTFTVLALTLRLADTLRRRHLDQGEP
jgi:choline dehydrogenase-like flavoprotein